MKYWLFNEDPYNQWLFLVPVKGGIGSIFHPPGSARTISGIYKWYILPIGGLYATYHLLREPETTIDIMVYHKPHIRG